MKNNRKTVEQRGYQPKPNGKFGYQPIANTSRPLVKPTSGSDIVKPNCSDKKG